MGAIRSALTFLSFEELPKDERPPKRMWLRGKELREWFEEVERRRDQQYRNDRPEIEDPVENDAAASLLID